MDDAKGVSTMSVEDLAKAVQNLPPELFNKIFDLTFSTDVNNNGVVIDQSYRHPHLLHVDRTSRSVFGQMYYGGTIFLIPKAEEYFPSWLHSLDPEFLKIPFREIRFLEHTAFRHPNDATNLYGIRCMMICNPSMIAQYSVCEGKPTLHNALAMIAQIANLHSRVRFTHLVNGHTDFINWDLKQSSDSATRRSVQFRGKVVFDGCSREWRKRRESE